MTKIEFVKKIYNKLKRLNLTKIKAFFRIKIALKSYLSMFIASLHLRHCSNCCDFNKKQHTKFKKSLFYLTKKEKIILMRNTLDKTYFS